MYKELRPVAEEQPTASTPEMWAANFAAATKMTTARTARFEPKWSIIRRVFPARGRILDAGCGFGEWVYFLEKHGYEAMGLDYSSELVDRLRAAYPQSTWVRSDIRAIPLPDNSLDGIISWGVIEHDEAGPGTALREFYRIVKPGGAIIVSVPRDSARQRKSSRAQFPDTGTMAFFQYFMTEEELGVQVQHAGFEVEEVGSVPQGSFALLAPKTYTRMRELSLRNDSRRLFGLPLRIANSAGVVLLKPFKDYRGMNYCVGRKRNDA